MNPKPLVGVGVIIVDEGRLLLLKRKSVHGAGTWSTPGGHLEFRESPDACAIREVKEETGVSIGHVHFIAITNDDFAASGKHYVTIWMQGCYISGKPAIKAPYEMSAVDWFAPPAQAPRASPLPRRPARAALCVPSQSGGRQELSAAGLA